MSKRRLKDARALLDAGQLDAAKEALDALLAERDTDTGIQYNALVLRGLALSRLSSTGEAIKSYQTAIALSPTQALAWQGLSKVLESEERWADLAEALDELLRIFQEACVTARLSR